MISDDVGTARQSLHDIYFISKVELMLFILANKFFECIVSFIIHVLDQEDIAIAAFCDLMNFFESFSVDVEGTGAFEEIFNELEAVSHYYYTIGM
jgi:hypothetical protein